MTALAEVQDLRDWLQDQDIPTGTATVALAAASGVVRDATGRHFSLVLDDEITIDGTDDQWLTLPGRPVLAVNSVAINGATQDVSSWTRSGSRLYRHAGWNARFTAGNASSWCAPNLITVRYDHGYPQIPDGVVGAVLAIASDIVRNPGGLIAETIDDYTWRRSETPEGTAADIMLKSVVRRYGTSSRTLRLGRR